MPTEPSTHQPRPRRSFARWLPLLAIGAAIACGTEGPPGPSDSDAKRALEAALNAWKEGKPCGEIPGITPPTRVVDCAWSAGEKLGDFAIVGEPEGGAPGAPRTYRTKLTMTKPPGEREVAYVLMGADPLIIYREDDFQRAMNMDNNPGAKRPKSSR